MKLNRYISGLKDGNSQIVKEIYEKNLPHLRSWVLKNNGSEADALDTFQEGIESMIGKIYAGKIPDKLNFEGYLFTICKNKWFDKIKNKNREEQVRTIELERYTDDEQVQIELLDDDHQTDFLKVMLDDTFVELSEVCQKLLGLIESGISTSEVALQMNMTNANTVYRRKFACYESWRNKLKQHKYYSSWDNNKT